MFLKYFLKILINMKKDKFLDFLAIETNLSGDNNYEMKLIFAGDSINKSNFRSY